MGVVIFCIWAASVDEKAFLLNGRRRPFRTAYGVGAFFAREHDEPPFTDRRTIISERRNFCSPSTELTDHLPQNTHSYGIHYYKYGSRGVALSSMERQKRARGLKATERFLPVYTRLFVYIHSLSCSALKG